MLVDQIVATIGDIRLLRKITPKELARLGYNLGGRNIPVCQAVDSEPAFTIQEVIDTDSKKTASFCYLFSRNKRTGAILKYEYDYYLNIE